MSKLQKKTILIAASGTGGHLFPALFVAKALQERDPSLEIHFLGAGRPLEEKILDPTGFPRHTIRMVGVNKRGIRGIAELLTVLPAAILRTIKLFRTLRPSVVVGVGGYTSVLPVLYGWLRGIPTWIHEAEVSPGLANSVLGYVATKVSTAFQQTRMPYASRVVWTGHPVRPEVYAVAKKKREPLTHILIMGGSQGAQGLDEGIQKLADFITKRGLQILHQCRAQNVDQLKAFYQREGITADVVSFIEKPHDAYEWAHIIITRSGAGTVSELSVTNRPAILVPYPSRAIKQYENAEVMASAGKALLVEEGSDLSIKLEAALEKLLNPEFYHAMEDVPARIPNGNAAHLIAEGVTGLMRRE